MNEQTIDWDFIEPQKKVGFISFTDPRSEVKFIEARENYIKNTHTTIKKMLEKKGFKVIDPNVELEKDQESICWGISKLSEIKSAKKLFLENNINSLIYGCFTWNEPDIPLELAKDVNVPLALISVNNKDWPGITALSSTGATFWQKANNTNIKTHERFLFTKNDNYDDINPWLNATTAINHLQKGKLLLWGGTPALHMEHLNDDINILKQFIIADILIEDQNSIVTQTELILTHHENRIKDFLNWLERNNCKIIYDEKMVTAETINKQIALYFAAKDLLYNHLNTNNRIIGISIKCQPELSVDYGVTPCFLPAFLPFPVDSEGIKPIVPSVCEGDIKGLITSCLLYGINNKIPPLFGDLKILTEDYFILANCGAASAYYAAYSNKPEISLSKSTIEAQCQGNSGGAFGYKTPETSEEATYARLCRIETDYYMQIGIGKIVSSYHSKQQAWGTTWPHTAVELKVPEKSFIKAIGANHLSLTLGNFEQEMKYIAKILRIPLVRLDDINSIDTFLENI